MCIDIETQDTKTFQNRAGTPKKVWDRKEYKQWSIKGIKKKKSLSYFDFLSVSSENIAVGGLWSNKSEDESPSPQMLVL